MVVRELLAVMKIQVDEKSVARADAAINQLKNTLLAFLGGAGVKAAFDGLKAKFQDIANTAVDLRNLAQKTGMTTDELQGLRYAAEQAGVDIGELQMGLVHLERAAFEAATRGGEAGQAFARLGVNVRGANGKLKPTAELLGDVADKFNAMPEGAEKAGLSMEILSRAGARMIPLLSQGSAGLARWGAEAQRTGGLMSSGMIRKGIELHEKLVLLEYAFKGLRNEILGPYMKAIIHGAKALSGWIEGHKKLISARIQDVVGVIAQAFQLCVPAIQNFGLAIIPIGAIILGLITPFNALMAALLFFAADMNRYLSGKDSVIGRLLQHYEHMKNPLVSFFDDARKAAMSFGAYLTELMNKPGVGALIGAAAGWRYGGPLAAAAGAVAGTAGPFATQNVSDAMVSPDSSDWLRSLTGWGSALVSETGRGAGLLRDDLRSLVFAPAINVTAGPGTDGAAVGKQIGDELVNHEDLKRSLREAAAK